MIVIDGTNPSMEKHKKVCGLIGDVYVYNGIFIESLGSHKVLIPDSKATTIQQAYDERVAYEEQKELERQMQNRSLAEEM